VTDIHTKLSPAFGLSWQVRIHLKFTFRDNWRCNGKGEAFLKISQLSAVRSFEVFSTSVSQMFGSRKIWHLYAVKMWKPRIPQFGNDHRKPKRQLLLPNISCLKSGKTLVEFSCNCFSYLCTFTIASKMRIL